MEYLVTPDCKRCCAIKAPRAGVMDLIYHHLQTAHITLNKPNTVRIVKMWFTEAQKKETTSVCHMTITPAHFYSPKTPISGQVKIEVNYLKRLLWAVFQCISINMDMAPEKD